MSLIRLTWGKAYPPWYILQFTKAHRALEIYYVQANSHPIDVLRSRKPLLRILHRWFHHQIPRPTRNRLCNSVCQEIHGRQRENRAEIPGTTGTDDATTTPGAINAKPGMSTMDWDNLAGYVKYNGDAVWLLVVMIGDFSCSITTSHYLMRARLFFKQKSRRKGGGIFVGKSHSEINETFEIYMI